MQSDDKRESWLTTKGGDLKLVGDGLGAAKVEALLRANLASLISGTN